MVRRKRGSVQRVPRGRRCVQSHTPNGYEERNGSRQAPSGNGQKQVLLCAGPSRHVIENLYGSDYEKVFLKRKRTLFGRLRPKSAATITVKPAPIMIGLRAEKCTNSGMMPSARPLKRAKSQSDLCVPACVIGLPRGKRRPPSVEDTSIANISRNCPQAHVP